MKIRLVAYRKATSSATVDTTYDLDLQKVPNVRVNYNWLDVKEPDNKKSNFIFATHIHEISNFDEVKEKEFMSLELEMMFVKK